MAVVHEVECSPIVSCQSFWCVPISELRGLALVPFGLDDI